MLKAIDHIGIAVEDLDDVIQTYNTIFNIKPSFIETVEEQRVKTAGFTVGESTVELLQATDEESPIAKFISKKGAGIHHIAYRVENLEKTLNELKEKKIRLIDEKPRQGADGKKIAFIHPKSTGGVLIELCE